MTILTNTSNTPHEVCSFVHNIDCGNGDVNGHRWKLKIPGGKPPVVPRPPPKVKASIKSEFKLKMKKKRQWPSCFQSDTPKLRVLHITDTHYDPLYKEGTKAVCDRWLCCRTECGMALKNESAAGKWGGWKCDIPERTLDSFLQHANSSHGVSTQVKSRTGTSTRVITMFLLTEVWLYPLDGWHSVTCLVDPNERREPVHVEVDGW